MAATSNERTAQLLGRIDELEATHLARLDNLRAEKAREIADLRARLQRAEAMVADLAAKVTA